jgi:4-amino-4-deoxy-L-arabinose transferase-like glycosyltransferase
LKDPKLSIIHIIILLALGAVIGIYLISTTTVIAKDGVAFIKYAKKLRVAPINTMARKYQHPGYPLLILLAHKITSVLREGVSIWSWIYCAQGVALTFRLLAIAVLYFVGRYLVGAELSFWAVLILVFLPKPAAYGSDALSDWPHIFFLAVGIWLLMRAANGKWWLFGCAGLSAGMGYLIRPECAQVVVFGSFWLGLQLLWSKRTMGQREALCAMALLLVGFLLTVAPYMKLKGAVFPKKQLVSGFQADEICEQSVQIHSNSPAVAGFASSKITRGLGKLVERVSDTLMWFFVPALLLGIYGNFRKCDWYRPEKFFIIALVVLNVPLMVLLYCKYGYMSGRHTFPLVIFTIFYASAGLQAMGAWLQNKLSKDVEKPSKIKTSETTWFLVLLAIGIFICIPKLLTPIRTAKQSFRDVAQWLAAHTDMKDKIAVPDIRISFYAQRKGLICRAGRIPKRAQYIVREFKAGEAILPGQLDKVEHEYVDQVNGNRVVIYRKL